MDRIDAMRVFAGVVERSSFTQTARDLSMPRSTVTEAVRQIEDQLGVKLLERTTRTVAPTAEGRTYYRRCLEILAAVDGLQSEVAGTALSGPLRVEVDEALLHGLLLPALPSFFEANPGITLHLGPPTPTGLEPAGASPDCALRLSRTTTASGSVPIGRLSRGTFASPGHLGRGGTKEIDLATCALVGLRTRTGELLAFDLPTERSAPTPPLVATVQSELAAIGLAKLGLGLVQVHRCLVEADLASGALVEVHPDSPPGASLVHLLRPDGALSPRLRAFVGWVGERIEPALLRS